MRGANTPAYRGMGTPRVRRVFARRDDELGAGCVVVAEVARRYEQRVVNIKAYVDVHVRRGDSGSCRFRTPQQHVTRRPMRATLSCVLGAQVQ